MPREQSPGKPTTRRYSDEEKAAAVRMVRTLRAELGSEHGTVKRVADQLGYGVESVRLWVHQADIDDGHEPGVSTEEAARVRELEQEVRELRRANEILKRAASFSGRSSTASIAGSGVHRRPPRHRGRRATARGRAHLPGPAGGPEHLLTTAPALIARPGIGIHSAAQLLITAGGNPDRLHSDAAFAALCGASPVQASSGQHQRHRLNRGGDRAANNALWTIANNRLIHDPRTREFAAKRRAQGDSRNDVLRILKRYIARETFSLIIAALHGDRAFAAAA